MEFSRISDEDVQMVRRFQLHVVPSVILVWIGLEGLAFYLFNKSSLFSIAGLVGKPTKLDELTVNFSRPSVPRICVEIDLLQALPSHVWIGTGGTAPFWQHISYEELPATILVAGRCVMNLVIVRNVLVLSQCL